MAVVTETISIDVDLDDFDDKELIEELRARGYYVGDEDEMFSVEAHWQRGDKKEALILLEREYPALFGIAKLIN